MEMSERTPRLGIKFPVEQESLCSSTAPGQHGPPHQALQQVSCHQKSRTQHQKGIIWEGIVLSEKALLLLPCGMGRSIQSARSRAGKSMSMYSTCQERSKLTDKRL